MKTILILRHAKSARHGEMPDFDRPLNSRGKRNAKLMARFLRQTELMPQKIFSSPAERTKATVKEIIEIAVSKKQTEPKVEYLSSFYLGSVSVFLETLQDQNETVESVLLCGHNPALEELTEKLCCQNLDLHLPTCGLVVLQFFGEWKNIERGRCQLHGMYHPKLLDML